MHAVYPCQMYRRVTTETKHNKLQIDLSWKIFANPAQPSPFPIVPHHQKFSAFFEEKASKLLILTLACLSVLWANKILHKFYTS